MVENTAIITGTSGALGLAYLNHYLANGYTCVSISRSPLADPSEVIGDRSKWEHHTIDLTNKEACRVLMEGVVGKLSGHVKLVHCVGMFKFEDDTESKAPDFIDDEVLRSNVDSFTNIVDPVMAKLGDNQVSSFTFAAFGSISDVYKVPFWRSYSLAKDALRKEMSALVASEKYGIPMNAVFINVSTVDTGHENKLRPCATKEEKAFWLTPDTIVERTINDIENPTVKFNEKDVYEDLPGFKPDEYFRNPEVVKERWMGMMGRAEKAA